MAGDGELDLFAPTARPAVRELTLNRLAGELARSFATVGRVSIPGEVHRATVRNGRTWFTLKDRAATMPVTVSASAARRSRVVDGERVLVTGTLEWQTQWGRVQLRAEEVVPTGEGPVAAQIAAARLALAADGLLDRPRRPMPVLPRAIGVLCGAEAAVLHDIRAVVAARWPGYPLVVRQVPVSGGGAAADIEAGLADLAATAGVDVVVMARGGGDATHLLPWSDEQLCRAVASCPAPVVSAIGHEADRPLCDEVADLRCGTPSIAAAAVVPDRAALHAAPAAALAIARSHVAGTSAGARQRLDRNSPRQALGDASARAGRLLERGADRLHHQHPGGLLPTAASRLHGLDRRGPIERAALRAGDRLALRRAALDALAPMAVLDRGYALVRDETGAVVRDAAAVAPGDVVEITVARGRFRARVEDDA